MKVQAKEEEAGSQLALTRSDVEKLSKEYRDLTESIGVSEEANARKLEESLQTIQRQASECEALKQSLANAEEESSKIRQTSYERENEILVLKEKGEEYDAMRKVRTSPSSPPCPLSPLLPNPCAIVTDSDRVRLSHGHQDVEQKIKEIQSLNESLSSALANIDGDHHLAGILTKDINKGLQNYIDDIIECKTPRSIAGIANPFTLAEEGGPKPSLDQILGSNGSGGVATSPKAEEGGEKASESEEILALRSKMAELSRSRREALVQMQQREKDFANSDRANRDLKAEISDLQKKMAALQSELDATRLHPSAEISIGSVVASPSRSRSHTVDNAVFKEHSSLSEPPQMMINENEDIEFSSSGEDDDSAHGDRENGGRSSNSLIRAHSSPTTRAKSGIFTRQNSNRITEGIAEDLRVECDSLRIKLTQIELENEALNRKLKEKEKEIGKQTTREMETIRRASAVYDTQATNLTQKGFWKGKRRSNSNTEEMQTLVSDLTGRYSDLSLKYAEKCSEADELKHQLKRKDVEMSALRDEYAIPEILEQNNNIWVSFRVFIPGDDEKGVPTCLLVGTDGIYIPRWLEQQFYDYTTIAKFEVRDNEFVFWALTAGSRKLNEVNLYCNAVLPSAILSSLQAAIKVKLDVHNTATSSIKVAPPGS